MVENETIDATSSPAQSSVIPPKPIFGFKDKIELYKIFRTQVEHEDNLVNQRLTWLLFSEAFLFTAYFTGLNNFLDESKVTLFKNPGIFCILLVIAVAGVFLVFFGFRGIYGAFEAIKGIRRQWYFHFPEEGQAHKDNNYYYPNEYSNISKDPVKKQFADITYLGDNKFKNDIQNVDPGYAEIESIRPTLETLKLMFKKGVGSRTTAFGTPMIIFSMWMLIIIIQFLILIPSSKEVLKTDNVNQKLDVKTSQPIDNILPKVIDSNKNQDMDTNVQKFKKNSDELSDTNVKRNR